jgi:methyl-accepting chemotaxis protein
MNLTIAKKLYTVAIMSVLAVVGTTGVAIYTKNIVNDVRENALILSRQAIEVGSLKQTHLEILLAATEAASSRSVGIIRQDRKNLMNNGLDILEENIPKYKNLYGNTLDNEKMEAMSMGLQVVAFTIRETLPEAIENGAPDFTYDQIDTSLDAFGSRLSEGINLLVEEANRRSELALTEGQSKIILAQTISVGIGIIFLIILLPTLFQFVRDITKSIADISSATNKLAAGNVNVKIPSASRNDELGDMARALHVFQNNISAIKRLNVEKEQSDKAAYNARQAMLATLETEFGHVVRAASRGDFSARVEHQFEDERLDGLGQSLNTLVEIVESGLEETMRVAAALSRGRVEERMEGEYYGSFAALKTDMNSLAIILEELIGDVETAATSVRAAMNELSAGSVDLSRRTSEQATTIEQTSRTMSHLSEIVTSSASSATRAAETASEIEAQAATGGEVIQQTNSAMQRISTSSDSIVDIIKLIDDIAFQTNLLALNAAVEAARAGEAGRGFAVVANEVRRLAQSAAQASQDVKGLIQTSVDEVKSGVDLVARASSSLQNILEGVSTMSGLFRNIAAASNQQAKELDSVVTAMHQLDTATQQNAALVEQTNNAIFSTENEAQRLEIVLERYRGSIIGGSVPENQDFDEKNKVIAS